MSDREYHGKEEEKEHEKEEEKSMGAWGYEKWHRDPLGGTVWAAILIWAGLVLLAGNMGYLANQRVLGYRLEAWPVILIGAGMIILLEVVVRLLIPSYRRPVGGTFIFAIILLGLGLGNLVSMAVVWPLVLIAIGLSILLRGLFRRR
jgi:hypothetical protein